MKIRLEFKPQDLWIGVFWRYSYGYEFDIWICLVPMLPIHLTFEPPLYGFEVLGNSSNLPAPIKLAAVLNGAYKFTDFYLLFRSLEASYHFWWLMQVWNPGACSIAGIDRTCDDIPF